MTEAQSMGAYLRSARRRRRVSIERAAEDTKIRADYLMRMESDELDFLAPAYVRGFIKTYARYLHVDPDPLIHEFERRHGTGRVDTAQLIAERGRQSAGGERVKVNSWMVAAATALVVIVALGLVGLGEGGDEPPARTAGSTPRIEDTEAPEETPSPEPSATPEETPEEDVFALEDGIEVTVDAARANCWIDVTADGQKVFSETVLLGESHTFSARRSMTLILGFPQGIDLVVNGRNLGAPGGANPITIKLPDDVDTL